MQRECAATAVPELLQVGCSLLRMCAGCRGGSSSTVGGGIRRRETERLFSSAASRLVEWEQDVCSCDKA